VDALVDSFGNLMKLNDLFGIREFHYRFNEPLVVRYVFTDVDVLNELNSQFYPDWEGLASASVDELKAYERVIKVRDTRIYDPGIQSALKKIHEGLQELITYKLLAGEDKSMIREGTLSDIL